MCSVIRIDGRRNEEVRRRVGVGEKLDRKVLKLFGRVERMNWERLTKKYTSLWWKVEVIQTGLARGVWTKSKWREMRNHWSLEIQM